MLPPTSQHLMQVYPRLEVQLVRGEGVWLFDTEGNRYLDAISGIGVTLLGHAHPVITNAIQQQVLQVLHTSNLYYHPAQIALAQKLCQLSGLSQAFFCNSGAEANEAALKVARLYGHDKGISEPSIIVMEDAFHGRTLATLSASGNPKIKKGFEPLLPGFIRVPFNDLKALEAQAHEKNIVAVLLEPIQGAGGVIVPRPDYLRGIRALCDNHGWLLMLDEIQTGLGRTGALFAHQLFGIQPDVMTLAKGLANGLPMGACLISEKLTSLFSPGRHGSTFGGNPVACQAALATLEVIEHDRLWEHAKDLGAILVVYLRGLLSDHSAILNIQSQGLMIGIQLDRPCGDLMRIALKHGLLINVTNDRFIRLLPALILEETHIIEIATRLNLALQEFLA